MKVTVNVVIVVSLLASRVFADEGAIVRLDPPECGFFAKKTEYRGIPIEAPREVDDRALVEARRRLARLLDHAPDIVYNLAQGGAELHIIGKDQQTSDLPYLRQMRGKPYERRGDSSVTIDTRTRGVGGLQASCGEENLLKLPSDRYRDHRDICSHEFAHTILEYGLSADVRRMVERQYDDSMNKGRWKNAYAATNVHEFFAELSMWYIGSRGDYGKLVPRPNEGPEWLRQYDPDAYKLLDDIYSGRQKVARKTWRVLVRHPASEETKPRAESSSQSTTVVFENKTDAVCKLFWIDAKGQRKSYGEIHPGEKRRQHTFAASRWVIVRPDNAVAGVFVAEKEPGRAIVK